MFSTERTVVFMSYDLQVLRALLRLSRRSVPASVDELLVRVGGEPDDVRRALGALVRSELVQRTPRGPALTLAGLAVAVASLPPRKKAAPPRARRTQTGAVALRLGLTQSQRRAA